MHAERPNILLHYDFLYVFNSYVLVLKDDHSKLLELTHAAAANHFVVVEALLAWYSRNGLVLKHVSDQGSHFKNSVLKLLNSRLGTEHHFTTAYSL